MAFDPLLVYYLASDLLACAADRVALTDRGIPDGMRVGVVPGEVAFDDCCNGMLVATIGDAYPTTNFPLSDLTAPPCGIAEMAVDITVWIVRCAPSVSQNGGPPTVMQLDESARTWAADARAVWTGMNCCLATLRALDLDAVLRIQSPFGPEGGCVGSHTRATIGINDPCECGPTVLRAEGLIVDGVLSP